MVKNARMYAPVYLPMCLAVMHAMPISIWMSINQPVRRSICSWRTPLRSSSSPWPSPKNTVNNTILAIISVFREKSKKQKAKAQAKREEWVSCRIFFFPTPGFEEQILREEFKKTKAPTKLRQRTANRWIDDWICMYRSKLHLLCNSVVSIVCQSPVEKFLQWCYAMRCDAVLAIWKSTPSRKLEWEIPAHHFVSFFMSFLCLVES